MTSLFWSLYLTNGNPVFDDSTRERRGEYALLSLRTLCKPKMRCKRKIRLGISRWKPYAKEGEHGVTKMWFIHSIVCPKNKVDIIHSHRSKSMLGLNYKNHTWQILVNNSALERYTWIQGKTAYGIWCNTSMIGYGNYS